MKYIPPSKFCAFPSLGYWAINDKPVSGREVQYGCRPNAKWKESEISKNLTDYIGYFVQDKGELMTREKQIRRAGYLAGWAARDRQRKNGASGLGLDHDTKVELLQALSQAIVDGCLKGDHPSQVVYLKLMGEITPSVKARVRKICKGSVARWFVEGITYAGGTLTEFVRYTSDGEIWKVQTMQGDISEKLITLDMITRFGPKRTHRARKKGD